MLQRWFAADRVDDRCGGALLTKQSSIAFVAVALLGGLWLRRREAMLGGAAAALACAAAYLTMSAESREWFAVYAFQTPRFHRISAGDLLRFVRGGFG